MHTPQTRKLRPRIETQPCKACPEHPPGWPPPDSGPLSSLWPGFFPHMLPTTPGYVQATHTVPPRPQAHNHDPYTILTSRSEPRMHHSPANHTDHYPKLQHSRIPHKASSEHPPSWPSPDSSTQGSISTSPTPQSVHHSQTTISDTNPDTNTALLKSATPHNLPDTTKLPQPHTNARAASPQIHIQNGKPHLQTQKEDSSKSSCPKEATTPWWPPAARKQNSCTPDASIAGISANCCPIDPNRGVGNNPQHIELPTATAQATATAADSHSKPDSQPQTSKTQKLCIRVQSQGKGQHQQNQHSPPQTSLLNYRKLLLKAPKDEREQTTSSRSLDTPIQQLQATANAITKLIDSTDQPDWHHNIEMLINGITAAKNAICIITAASAQLMNRAMAHAFVPITRYYNRYSDFNTKCLNALTTVGKNMVECYANYLYAFSNTISTTMQNASEIAGITTSTITTSLCVYAALNPTASHGTKKLNKKANTTGTKNKTKISQKISRDRTNDKLNAASTRSTAGHHIIEKNPSCIP